jgi:phosphate transport system substrate-binding protein
MSPNPLPASIRRLLGLLLVATATSPISSASAAVLHAAGSTTVNPVVVEAAEILEAKKGIEIQVDTQGGSTGGISALGDGRVEVAMSSRPLEPGDRAKYPKVRFTPVTIGEDAVAVIVSRDVWEGGVRALSREQVQRIYERRVTNWQQVGGPDRKIVFFNKEPGRGTWEVFAKWLYGDAKKAPPVSHPEVGANEEARTKVASTRGALSQLSSSWADGKQVFALAITVAPGKAVAPTNANIANGTYPLRRALYLITDGPATGEAKALIDFVLSPEGQALVRKHGYLALADLPGHR